MTDEEKLLKAVTEANKAWDAYDYLRNSQEWNDYPWDKKIEVIHDMVGITKIKFKAEDRLTDEFGYEYTELQKLGR